MEKSTARSTVQYDTIHTTIESPRYEKKKKKSRQGRNFFAHVQTGPGAHPASCTMGAGSFPGVKWLRCGADHPPPLAPRSRECTPLWAFESVTGYLYLNFYLSAQIWKCHEYIDILAYGLCHKWRHFLIQLLKNDIIFCPKQRPLWYPGLLQVSLPDTIHLMGLIDSPLCSKCGVAHILCRCEALASLRHAYLGSFFLKPENIKNVSTSITLGKQQGSHKF
jgi:hypothetical protein